MKKYITPATSYVELNTDGNILGASQNVQANTNNFQDLDAQDDVVFESRNRGWNSENWD